MYDCNVLYSILLTSVLYSIYVLSTDVSTAQYVILSTDVSTAQYVSTVY